MSTTWKGVLIAIGAMVGGLGANLLNSQLPLTGNVWPVVIQGAGTFGGAILMAHIVL